MLVIKASVRNQRLSRYTTGIVTEDSYGYLKFEFNFKTADWDNAAQKMVVFSYNGENTPPIELDENNQCYVPAEVIKMPHFKVAVYGGDIVTNTIRIPVEEGKNSSGGNIGGNTGTTDSTQPQMKMIAISLPAANWIGEESPYYQILDCDSITSNSKVDLQPSPEQLVIFHQKDLVFTTSNEDGTVKIYSIGDKPANDYVIQATITEVEADE